MELSNNNEINDMKLLNSNEIIDMDKLINNIYAFKLVLTKYYENYNENGHHLTPKLIQELQIEYDKVFITLKNMPGEINNKEVIWMIIYKIINKQTEIIKRYVLLLPIITLNDAFHDYLNRKIKIKSFQHNIPLEINNIKTINVALTNLIHIDTNKHLLTIEEAMNIIESVYICPFWYNFSNELSNFRDLIELFKSSYIKSHNYSMLFKPIIMANGAMSNLYNRTYGSNISVNETFKSMKENENIELLQHMWNQGEHGIGYGLVSLVLPKVNVVEWIKILVTINKIKKYEFQCNEMECLLIANGILPFAIPNNKCFDIRNKININKESNINVILHFHGGGFVSGSPHTHQPYLRKWALDTNSIIISVNYTKSPKVKFPVALNECYYIYKLLIKGKLFGFEPNKIILIGDSAGGNLVLSVTYKAIMENLRIPNGLLLAYPALDCDKTVTLSRYLFSYDILLSYNLLLICGNAYLPENSDCKNPFLSPLYATDEIIKKLPNNIYIISASYCPLLDDATNFVNKLNRNNKPFNHHIFDLPHGFLNFNNIIPSVNEIIMQCSDHINSIFSS